MSQFHEDHLKDRPPEKPRIRIIYAKYYDDHRLIFYWRVPVQLERGPVAVLTRSGLWFGIDYYNMTKTKSPD